MTRPIELNFADMELGEVRELPGVIVVFATPDGKLSAAGRKVNSASKKVLTRYLESPAFEGAANGSVSPIAFPAGMAADAIMVVKLDKKAKELDLRKVGAKLSKAHSTASMHVLCDGTKHADELAFGFALRQYSFAEHKTAEAQSIGDVTFHVKDPEVVAQRAKVGAAISEGVFFTRDLTNEPANVLTTDDFAARLAAMQELGLEVEILDEEQLSELGMGALLCVGKGSVSPSKVVVMQWNGGGDEAPLALVGKGVVFDTGGISLKNPGGMEEMTMDMGGAGVVAGVMRTLALRKAKANVVGLVGLVENMPSGEATRPGDVVKSMKGDTIEVINTDAEGRLVLADVLWYAQERFKPSGVIDLATLTGAMLVALGHDRCGVYSNSDPLVAQLLKAADEEGEGAWRMPLGDAYAKGLKSRIADMKNVGGRYGGANIAAEFLRKFVKDETPWCHLDIAGVALTKSETPMAPAGATGWGVMTLNRLIADHFEG